MSLTIKLLSSRIISIVKSLSSIEGKVLFPIGIGLMVYSICNFVEPDSSVLTAAKAIVPNPIVSKGQLSFFSCADDELWVFTVYDQSKLKKGVVCTGIFKGATPRFE